MNKKSDKNIVKTIITGPSFGFTDNFPKRQMWDKIAKELNGEFKIKYDPGICAETHNIVIPYKKYNITISVSDTRPLKFRVDFLAKLNFKLMLSWEDFIEKILKKFSSPEIELGWKEFDDRYLIKSNNKAFVREIISIEVQKSILKYNIFSIIYSTDLKLGTSELISVIQRQAGNKEMILELIEMQKQLIDKFEKLKIIK
jgi:hypothetical protein